MVDLNARPNWENGGDDWVFLSMLAWVWRRLYVKKGKRCGVVHAVGRWQTVCAWRWMGTPGFGKQECPTERHWRHTIWHPAVLHPSPHLPRDINCGPSRTPHSRELSGKETPGTGVLPIKHTLTDDLLFMLFKNVTQTLYGFACMRLGGFTDSWNINELITSKEPSRTTLGVGRPPPRHSFAHWMVQCLGLVYVLLTLAGSLACSTVTRVHVCRLCI